MCVPAHTCCLELIKPQQAMCSVPATNLGYLLLDIISNDGMAGRAGRSDRELSDKGMLRR